jgi:hypothetical protein
VTAPPCHLAQRRHPSSPPGIVLSRPAHLLVLPPRAPSAFQTHVIVKQLVW